MKIGLPLLFLVVFVQLSYSSVLEKVIRYDQNNGLTWNDFKGKPVKSSKYAAKTNSGYNYNVFLQGDSMSIVLPCLFYPKSSWVKKELKSSYLLKHEQIHFDITELFVRKMRKDLQAGRYTIKNFEKSAIKIIKKYQKQSAVFQNKYDKQTNHSINKSEQERWNTLVQKGLKELESYKTPVFKVKIKM